MKTYRVGVIPGDGTGPEVVAEAEKVLDAAARKFGFKLERTGYDIGGERYKRTGEVLPDSVLAELRTPAGDPARRDRPSRRQARDPREGDPAAGPLRARPVHQPAADPALSRRRDADQGQGAEGDRLRRRAREQRRHLHRHGRDRDEGHLGRGRHPDHVLHPLPGGALPALGVRVRAQVRQEGARRRREEHARARRQDERAHLRLRPLGARLPRDRRARLSRTSRATTTTSTPAACGWSRARSGSTCSSPATSSATSSRTSAR